MLPLVLMRSLNTGYKFEGVAEPPPPEVDDEARRREEEELQRVLEMSKNDKGGRAHWIDYTAPGGGGGSSAAAGPSSSTGATAGPSSNATKYPGGYTPAASPALTAETRNQPLPPRTSSNAPQRSSMHIASSSVAAEAAAAVQRKPSVRAESILRTASPVVASPATPVQAATSSPALAPASVAAAKSISATRVRALHKFEPTEPGELGFAKGDVIKVVDRGYKDWWRGQLRGRTGIFPVNYVVRPSASVKILFQLHSELAQCRNRSQNPPKTKLFAKRKPKPRFSRKQQLSTNCSRCSRASIRSRTTSPTTKRSKSCTGAA